MSLNNARCFQPEKRRPVSHELSGKSSSGKYPIWETSSRGKRPVGEKSTGESSAMERKMSGNVNEQKEVRDHFCEGQGALL